MKILMVAMSLRIGGAETHIVELSKALMAEGVSVTVASAGGVYTQALIDAGIPHVTLPLDRKDPIAVMHARRGLKKLIKRECFDIVHAHARIPAFLCGTLQKKLGFRFVTTDHLDFKVTPFLKRLTNWGDYTFAVSEDLKGYLLQNYEINPAHIGVIVNGINTHTFSPEVRADALRATLRRGERPVVLHISRLAPEVSVCADALIGAVERLEGFVSLVIVGDGTHRDALCRHAEAVNRALGFEAVTLVGAKTNIAEYIAACDCFVGPSRAAMEAMACGKPTILSGSQGHGGIFTDALIPSAVESNFCFRGNALPTSEVLAEEITKLLSLSESERVALGERAHRFIAAQYSVERMMRTQLETYRELARLPKGKTDILVCGYYGYGNAGDETILSSLIDGIRRRAPELGICVMSADPARTASYYMVDAVHRFLPISVARKMKSKPLFLFGGGNLLQDKTSKRSLYYYCKMIHIAHRRGCPVMIYANGIGPLCGTGSEKRVRESLQLAETLSFRERISFERAGSFVMDFPRRLTFDPAILIRPAEKVDRDNHFVIVPKAIGAGCENVLITLIERVRGKYGLTPLLISLYDTQDMALCHTIAARTGAAILSMQSAREVVSLFARARFVVSSRLHGLIYATSAACPMMSYSDDEKLASYLDYIGLGSGSGTPCAADADVDGGKLFSMVEMILQKEDGIRRTLSAGLPMWRTLAEYEFSEIARAAKRR